VEVHQLLLYDYVDGMLERRVPYRDAHLERIRVEREAGRIVMSGPLGDPPTGAAIVFRGLGPDQVEGFANADPYVQAGLVTAWRVQRWTVA
jgi:uncharacterized protein